MTNKAFVGRAFLARGAAGSPPVFTRISQVYGLSGVGQKNTLVDVTTFDSGGVMEYASGLADGSEITAELNFETQAPVIPLMVADVKAKAVQNFQIEFEGTVAGTVDLTLAFAARCMSWEVKPLVAGKNSVAFGLKITGDVTLTVVPPT